MFKPVIAEVKVPKVEKAKGKLNKSSQEMGWY